MKLPNGENSTFPRENYRVSRFLLKWQSASLSFEWMTPAFLFACIMNMIIMVAVFRIRVCVHVTNGRMELFQLCWSCETVNSISSVLFEYLYFDFMIISYHERIFTICFGQYSLLSWALYTAQKKLKEHFENISVSMRK